MTAEQIASTPRIDPVGIAKAWERWCGPSKWSINMRALQGSGALVIWYCGYPQSCSAIPLCFSVDFPDGQHFGSRLKDLQAAVHYATGKAQLEKG